MAPITLIRLVCLAATGLLAAQEASRPAPQQEALTRVEGTVVDAATNAPLRKATVTLWSLAQGSVAERVATQTDAEGKFVIEGEPPGEYWLWAGKPGYVTTRLSGAASLGMNIRLERGKTVAGLSFRLELAAAISGRVIDDSGDPLPAYQVQILRKGYSNGRRQWIPKIETETGNWGEYRVTGLTPGRYLVLAYLSERPAIVHQMKLNEMLAATYHLDAPDTGSAAEVEIVAGRDASGIDIRVRRVAVRSIRGKVTGAVDVRRLWLMLVPFTREGEPSTNFEASAGNVQEDGSFEINQIRPGYYQLIAQRNVTEGSSIAGVVRVEVGETDVEDLNITLADPFPVRGTIKLAGKGDLLNSRITFQLRLTENEDVVAQSAETVASKGSFTIEGVTPGEYFVRVLGHSGPTYGKSINFGGQEVDAETPLRITGPTTMTVTVALEDGVVEGSVTSEQAEPTDRPKMVVVMSRELPASTRSAGHFYLLLDQNNHFEHRSVRPGKYRLWAIPAIDNSVDEMIGSPALRKDLENEGTVVEVSENARVSVELKPVSEDRLLKARERAGIE